MPSPVGAEYAKEFLISKVLRQADEDGVLLSDLERRMLNFCEGSASTEDIEAAEKFGSEYDNDIYEAKIAQLLRKAYQRDAKLGQQNQWQHAIKALRNEDWYIVVMLQQSGIRPSLGWHIAILCVCAGIETLWGLSYARGAIGLKWAVIGLIAFGFCIVRQVAVIKGQAGG